jgi:FKBP-type peptidyl-prolyl cis-trans isomerase FkpA
MKLFFSILFLAFVLNSCSKKNAVKQAAEDDKIILQYISDNSLLATKASSGLYYVIDEQGTGASCHSSSNVKVAYKGYFINGEVFDESASGITFNLQQVIEGWTLGIPYFKEGGSGKLLLPSALAYGKKGTSGIPENSVLIFDIELIEVL